jgi:hypothetical protein
MAVSALNDANRTVLRTGEDGCEESKLDYGRLERGTWFLGCKTSGSVERVRLRATVSVDNRRR